MTDGQQVALMVRERARGVPPDRDDGLLVHLDPEAYAARRRELLGWPLDFVMVEQLSSGELTVRAGEWGAAPLYLTRNRDGSVNGSWDRAELPRPAREGIDEVVAARFLAGLWTYGHRTLWTRVLRLSERSTARITLDQLRMDYPSAALQARPRRLRDTANPVSAFDALLDAAARLREHPTEASAVEISGGLDSATVALSVGSGDRVAAQSYALSIGGPAGGQQLRRRQAIVSHGQFDDVLVDAEAHLPLGSGGRRGSGRWIDPDEEPYGDALEAALAAVVDRGVRVVYTGIGGDELLAVHTPISTPTYTADSTAAPGSAPQRTMLSARARALVEELPHTPAAVVPEPALLAAGSRAPVFLRAGVWPVNPLCAPQLVRFGEWLPQEWRSDKVLFRQYLRECGDLSAEVLTPVLRENFAHVMTAAVRRFTDSSRCRRIRRSSRLAELGLIERAELTRVLSLARRDPAQAIRVGLYEVLVLELTLDAANL